MTAVTQIARRACTAQTAAATASTATKNAVLCAISDLLEERIQDLLSENQRDLDAARDAQLSAAMIDRLQLTPDRIQAMAHGVREIVAMDDPVGRMEDVTTRPNGLQVGRMRIPLGVIAIIFESRPNVVIDAGALTFKAGNAAILKGGKEAHHSNVALAGTIADALVRNGLPPEVVQLLTSREQVDDLLQLDEYVDLVIPRGGEGLIRHVCSTSRIPVIRHYKGVCHVFVDSGADLEMAHNIALNSKVQRPGVCNAMETLLVHEDVAADFLPKVLGSLRNAGVTLRGCPAVQQIVADIEEATEADWHEEYLNLTLAVRVVNDMNAAIEHIRRYGTDHTESIVTANDERARAFVAQVPSSAVMVNASTRFNDGGQLGLGAEIGISTSKIHAFGPMGLNELTTRKFVVFGDGHVRT